ncbi:E3 ubiquitin-protein ligase MGRN1-like isoform X2 [Ornithodoros turicata]|uniref:E3 ubiquitin-protein ligase MGRN1-like isoform X2 n=1 Tax=Ornithodoros turicata TaxID=34597 RepID=UPI003139C895
MGGLLSRQNVSVEETDSVSSSAYRYPPKSGNFFASHFIMGGERFDTNQPEAYLFGENTDLNFLGGKPTPFPYPAPQANEPTRPLRSLINIRKESVRFVRILDTKKTEIVSNEVEQPQRQPYLYNIEFTFDSDVRCAITIHYFCSEEITPTGIVYTPRNSSMSSETYHYKRGTNQQFSQTSHIIDPSGYSDEELNYHYGDDDSLPMVIHCVAEEGDEPRQSHVLVAVMEKNSDGTYALKPLKQKLFVDGLCYLLQEIYGIENKNITQGKTAEEEAEEGGAECVICMCDGRDTLILPCRHLCLCSGCADSLRYQANNCPICRAPFRALLQVRAVRRSAAAVGASLPAAVPHLGDHQACVDVPPGYEVVPLVEALNGPTCPAPIHLTVGLPQDAGSPDSSARVLRINRHRAGSNISVLGSPLGEVPSKVVVAQVVSSSEQDGPTEAVPRVAVHTGGDSRRLRRSSSRGAAPEQVRLLTQGSHRSKTSHDTDLAETRSLLEEGGVTQAQRPAPPRSSSVSTPHSLHLCEGPDTENKATDTSPGGEESDYYTPEDPATAVHFLVDRATDTSLDTPQAEVAVVQPGSPSDVPHVVRKAFAERQSPLTLRHDNSSIELLEVKSPPPTEVCHIHNTCNAYNDAVIKLNI